MRVRIQQFAVPAKERKRPAGWFPDPPVESNKRHLWAGVILAVITLPFWIIPAIAGVYLERKLEL